MTDPSAAGIDIGQLGSLRQIGAGVRGDVFQVSMPDTAYKQYRDATPAGADLSRLVALYAGADVDTWSWLRQHTAWPTTVVIRSGQPTGYLMRLAPAPFTASLVVDGVARPQLLSLADLLRPAADLAALGLVVSPQQQVALLRELAAIVVRLHQLGVAVGDLAARHVLVSLQPQPACFLLDCDSVRTGGLSAVDPYQTPGWELPAADELATAGGDSYRLGLCALRLLAGDPYTRDPSRLPAALPELAALTTKALTAAGGQRPTAAQWLAALERTAAPATLTALMPPEPVRPEPVLAEVTVPGPVVAVAVAEASTVANPVPVQRFEPTTVTTPAEPSTVAVLTRASSVAPSAGEKAPPGWRPPVIRPWSGGPGRPMSAPPPPAPPPAPAAAPAPTPAPVPAPTLEPVTGPVPITVPAQITVPISAPAPVPAWAPQPGPPAAPWPVPRPSGGGLPTALVVLIVLLVVGGGAALAYRLVNRPEPAPVSQPYGNNNNNFPDPGLSTSDIQPSTLAPPPTTPDTIVGVVDFSATADDPRAAAVAQLFDTYYTAINNRDYAVLLAQYDPQSEIGRSDASGVTAFENGISTSTDTKVRLVGLGDAVEGVAVTARVQFQSTQARGEGPARNPNETCTAWDITYSLTEPTTDLYLILSGKVNANTPC